MRPGFKEFRKEALKNPEVKKEYDRLKPIYDIKSKLIQIRLSEGLTQEEIAKKMRTTKSQISRFESVRSQIIPNLSTLIKYASAVGYNININFTKIKNV